MCNMLGILSSSIMEKVAVVFAFCSILFLYHMFFKETDFATKKMRKAVNKLRISKVNKNANKKRGEQYVSFVLKYHMQTPQQISDIKEDLYAYANEDFVEEAGRKLNGYLPLMITSGICIVSFITLYLSEGFMIMTIILFTPLLYLLSDIYRLLFTPQRFIKTAIKISVTEINKHFRDFFNHIYYYYAQDNAKVLLSDVMSSYLKYAPSTMKPIVKSILKDCEISEIKAMQNLRVRYSKSQKICELSQKLEKRISGHTFGKRYLFSMKESIDEEHEANLQLAEETKQEKYIALLGVGISIALVLSILGVMYVLMLHEGVFDLPM